MNGEVFISPQSWHFSLLEIIIKVLFPVCTLNWRVNNNVSRHGKGKKEETEVLILLINFVAFSTVLFLIENCLLRLKLFLHNKR